MSEIQKKSKSRLDILPNDDADLAEWKEWGGRIINRYQEQKALERKRSKQFRRLKNTIKDKQKANVWYKEQLTLYEEENIEPIDWAVLFQKFMFWR
ncbi:hypothetical protein H206_00355 [Candidatus Electrothrix aarhusensis]|uniref:Uncharacterized protein n=1 Tax=Candidatus Electrothrix aarhusensis TaxID=1859131 RepID=A0A3S3QFK8_9BACT|nr:hypothetical protein H206_00355 [Candidatus Electrothrix aarhusensis]